MPWTTTILALLPLISPQAPDDDPRQILAAAIKTQTPSARFDDGRYVSGTVPVITSYEASYKVSLHEDEKGNATPRRSGLIRQWWQRKDSKIRYHRVFRSEIGDDPPAHYITDGIRFWYQVEGGQPVVNMADDQNMQADLRNLREEIRRTGELMQLFFIGNVLDGATGVTLGKTDLDVDDPRSRRPKDRIKVDEVVVRREGKPTVVLRIGKKDRHVYEAELRPVGEDGPTELFAFGYHQALSDPVVGDVTVPTRLTYAKDGRTVMEANIPAPAKDNLSFNGKLSRSDFQPLRGKTP